MSSHLIIHTIRKETHSRELISGNNQKKKAKILLSLTITITITNLLNILPFIIY